MSETTPVAAGRPGADVCRTCGRALAPGARFCTGCGSAVDAGGPRATGAPAVTEIAPTSRRAERERRRGPVARGPQASGTSRPGAPATPPPAAPAAPAARPRVRGQVLAPGFDGATTADVGARVLAYLVDAAVVVVLVVLVLLLTGRWPYGVLAGVELVVGLLVWQAHTGATFGNAVLGLRSAREETPYAPGLGRALVRGLVLGAAHVVAGLGQLVVLASCRWDASGRRQTWHDKVGRTVVVDVRALERARAAEETRPAPAERRRAPVPAGAGTAAPAAFAPTPPARPGPPGPPAAATPPRAIRVRPAGTSYVLTLDTGEQTPVSGPGLIGRAPRAVEGERTDHLVAMEDPERSLSRTHARFGIDGGRFWVTDAGSGNGTVLVLPDGTAVVVPPGQRVPVPPGATVRIGDRSFTVAAAGTDGADSLAGPAGT